MKWLILTLALLAAGQEPANENRRRVESWREALELDLAAVVVREGPPLVTGRGALAQDAEAIALVARALGSVGRTATAFTLLDDARPETDTARAYIDLARASLYLDEDQLNELIGLLAPRGPDSLKHAEWPESWLLVGRAWARGGEGVKADVFLKRFLEMAPLHPAAPSAWYMLAQHAIGRREAQTAADLRARGEAAARWQSYYKARRLQKREDPSAALPRLGLAQLWMQVGRLEEARAELKELVAGHPEFERGWSHLGEVERLAGQGEEARTAFDRAIALAPTNAYSRLGRARLSLAMDDLDQARIDLAWLTGEENEDADRRRDAWLEQARVEASADNDAARDAALARYRELGGTEDLAPE